ASVHVFHLSLHDALPIFGGEEPFIEELLTKFVARIEDAANFARSRRVLLLRSHSGVGIDIALGGLPFEEEVVGRSTLFSFPGPRSESTRLTPVTSLSRMP